MRTLLFTLVIFALNHFAYSLDNQKFTEIYKVLSNKDYEKVIYLSDSLKAVSVGDDLGNCYYIIGYVHEQNNNVGLAVKNYLQAIDHFVDLEQTLRIENNIGNILTNLSLDQESLQYFNFIIENGQEKSKAVNYAYYNKAKAFSKLDMHDEALLNIEVAEKLAIERNDRSLLLKIQNRAGLINRKAGFDAQAIKLYDGLIEANTGIESTNDLKEYYRLNAWRGSHNMAFLYLNLKDTAKAILYYNVALKLSVHNIEKFESMKDLGDLYYELGQIESANELLNEALNFVGDDELLGKVENLAIFDMIALIEENPVKQVPLLRRGNALLTRYSKQKDEVIELHNRNLAALALNSHNEISKWQNVMSSTWVGIGIGLILLVILLTIYTIRLRRRNKVVSANADRLMEIIAPHVKHSD